ncbi:uncharacterized protein CG5098-like isoform X2 [Pectinophora gossypiella]|uniref:uncharacterized protein CG5098-like isoform X2 n=1 Tax=Pectinophora gossypiella TaxID=13191 RepID=UPI00214ED4CC|nr:uncharacterized protein CG5098-like isoform X2 [Pectinophora gossypiella]
MSGGSQHNPNGRQAPLGAGWSPLQVANFLARAPQAHMAAERGVTWHTPTPPPHLYHVPAPSPPDPLQGLLQLQAMKGGGNSVFRHTATPPELYRHTPTPPDKHLLRHTPSPGDVKPASAAIPPAELYPHLGPGRDKLVRPEELLAYARGVDLSVGARSANGAAAAAPAAPALSVRDAPTINSLIARAQPRPGHARVDALLERLSSSPASPHSVIVHPRAAHTPSPPPHDSNEDSADSCGAPPGSKRKRKPERTIRVSAPPPPIPPATSSPAPVENGDTGHANGPEHEAREPPREPREAREPRDTGEHREQTEHREQREPRENQPQQPLQPSEAREPQEPPPVATVRPPSPSPVPTEPPARRKARANSAETIDDIAAMIASDRPVEPESEKPPEPDAPVTIDKLKSVLASTDDVEKTDDVKNSPPKTEENKVETIAEAAAAAAPKRRSARTPNSESTNVPVESPSEAKPAEPEASEARSAEPTAASFVEVENQLEKMFAGIEEEAPKESKEDETPKPKKRRKSAPTKGEAKAGRRAVRAATIDGRRKGGKKKNAGKVKKTKESVKDAYDSGSNASSSRSRGPYIQIRGPRDSPVSVSVINAWTGEEEGEAGGRRKPDEFRNGMRVRGLHASTLGLRYDAVTPDATWLCAFCMRGPHADGLGDLFGPYTLDNDCEEYRALDEATRKRYDAMPCAGEVWFHAGCGVWAPGLVAAGARLWGLAGAVWAARGQRCAACGRPGAALACGARACRLRCHVPCAAAAAWRLHDHDLRAACPRHA